MDRIDMIQATVVVTSFDAEGRIVGQRTAQPITLYRATTPDVWAHLDALAKLAQPEQGEAPDARRNHL